MATAEAKTQPLLVRATSGVGRKVIGWLGSFGTFVHYLRETLFHTFRRPFRLRLILQQIVFLGNESLAIILISGFFIGAVFSLQIGGIFGIFGAEGMMGAASGKALARELSPLMTAFLLSGRGGAAITAEIATMKVNEQIDAMEAMAVDPISYLVVPRFLAALFIMPVLVGIFNLIGQIGSLVVGVVIFDVDQGVYFEKLVNIVDAGDVGSGMQKAIAFGAIISLLSCRYGLLAKGGAKGVGQATTNSVVTTLLVLLGVDYVITYIQIVL